jgi:ADP-ribose pyrophosphatase YjhB (NUDIX family)
VSEPIERPGARVVVLDGDDRVLLLRYEDPNLHWLLPGGGLEPGETPEQGAARELREEVGLDGVRLDPLNWTREFIARWGGATYHTREEYFAVRAPAGFEVVHLTEADATRWWSVREIEQARRDGVVIWPDGLEDRLRAFVSA